MSTNARISYSGELPGAGETVELCALSGLERYGIKWYALYLWHTANGTLNGYFWHEESAEWRLFSTAVLNSGSSASRAELFIEPFSRVKIEFVDGGGGQAIFEVNQAASAERSSALSNVGPVGGTGATGSAGATGTSGSVGATGATGIQGIQGDQGDPGFGGAQGATGTAGAAGATGATGTAGAVGATGAVGAAGATGATGSGGAAGSTGATGTAGTAGATGATGAGGAAGATGATGSGGAAGATGATGAGGAAGATGATGTAGAAGATGATGTAGAVGATGANAAAATQAEMETATSTAVTSTPGRQHFHPGHCKTWAFVTLSGGTPTLQTSYNVSGITDSGTGALTISIGNDFSSVNWSSLFTVEDGSGTTIKAATSSTKQTTNVLLQCVLEGGSQSDPTSWSFSGYGDL